MDIFSNSLINSRTQLIISLLGISNQLTLTLLRLETNLLLLNKEFKIR